GRTKPGGGPPNCSPDRPPGPSRSTSTVPTAAGPPTAKLVPVSTNSLSAPADPRTPRLPSAGGAFGRPRPGVTGISNPQLAARICGSKLGGKGSFPRWKTTLWVACGGAVPALVRRRGLEVHEVCP